MVRLLSERGKETEEKIRSGYEKKFCIMGKE